MNDNSSGNGSGRNYGPLIGFAAGALVGGLLGVLLAPASGARTRRRIAATALRAGNDARQGIDQARAGVADAASSLAADVKSAVTAGRDAFRHDVDAREARPASRVGSPGTAPTAHTP